MIESPRLRHPYCQIHNCSECLEDHEELEAYLHYRLGLSYEFDILRLYRKFLDEIYINSETDFGWAIPEAFNSENINSFIEYYTNE